MSSILDLVQEGETRRFDTGEVVFAQNAKSGLLWFLIEGTVEIVKDEVQVATASQPGAVFGELSALLDTKHTATVRALQPTTFRVIEKPRPFLEASPLVTLHVCELLARRLEGLTDYLVDAKARLGGEDRLGIVDGVLQALVQREPLKPLA